MASPRKLPHGEAGQSAPRYELRVRHAGLGRDCYEVWQGPSAGTPSFSGPCGLLLWRVAISNWCSTGSCASWLNTRFGS